MFSGQFWSTFPTSSSKLLLSLRNWITEKSFKFNRIIYEHAYVCKIHTTRLQDKSLGQSCVTLIINPFWVLSKLWRSRATVCSASCSSSFCQCDPTVREEMTHFWKLRAIFNPVCVSLTRTQGQRNCWAVKYFYPFIPSMHCDTAVFHLFFFLFIYSM